MNETPNVVPQKPDHAVAIWAIICTTIVMLTCISGCTVAIIALAVNIH